MSKVIVRPMLNSDIPAVVPMEHDAWHQYYSQYPIYQVIKDSVTLEGLTKDWEEFLELSRQTTGPLVVGQDRQAFVATVDGKVAGVGAVSSYVEGKWPEVDALLRGADGKVRKTAKFQELYVHQSMRGKGLGHHLSITRADAMLEKGYAAIFLTTYADAELTTVFHEKNGLKKVHEYMSMQTYADGKRARIGCFLDKDLHAYRERLNTDLQKKIAAGKALA